MLLRNTDMRLSLQLPAAFCPTNQVIDVPRCLFLELNGIEGNFLNCPDLICTSSFARQDIDGGSGGTTAF